MKTHIPSLVALLTLLIFSGCSEENERRVTEESSPQTQQDSSIEDMLSRMTPREMSSRNIYNEIPSLSDTEEIGGCFLNGVMPQEFNASFLNMIGGLLAESDGYDIALSNVIHDIENQLGDNIARFIEKVADYEFYSYLRLRQTNDCELDIQAYVNNDLQALYRPIFENLNTESFLNDIILVVLRIESVPALVDEEPSQDLLCAVDGVMPQIFNIKFLDMVFDLFPKSIVIRKKVPQSAFDVIPHIRKYLGDDVAELLIQVMNYEFSSYLNARKNNDCELDIETYLNDIVKNYYQSVINNVIEAPIGLRFEGLDAQCAQVNRFPLGLDCGRLTGIELAKV